MSRLIYFLFALISVANGGLVKKDNGLVPRLTDQRIVGGQDTDIAIHRHQISLRSKGLLTPENAYSHRCGGSIVAEDIIVTAAHCIIGMVPSQFQVVAGTNKRRGSDGYIVPVKEIIMHESYNPDTFDSDIAILILKEALPLNNFTIGVVELDTTEPKAGQVATVTGWGTTTMQGVASEHLQEVKVPIVSNELCNEDYDVEITDSMLCAGLRGLGGKDACQGDSGGPLLINKKLAGVVSWGYGCALPEYPGVYSKISYLLPWINDKIQKYHRQF